MPELVNSLACLICAYNMRRSDLCASIIFGRGLTHEIPLLDALNPAPRIDARRRPVNYTRHAASSGHDIHGGHGNVHGDTIMTLATTVWR